MNFSYHEDGRNGKIFTIIYLNHLSNDSNARKGIESLFIKIYLKNIAIFIMLCSFLILSLFYLS
jgi:hypothetical protein